MYSFGNLHIQEAENRISCHFCTEKSHDYQDSCRYYFHDRLPALVASFAFMCEIATQGGW